MPQSKYRGGLAQTISADVQLSSYEVFIHEGESHDKV
jgi:hypothetical protein